MVLNLRQYRICVTGGAGFLGREVVSTLQQRGLSSESIFVPRSSDYDLTNADGAKRLLRDCLPDIVIHLAAKVGGIGANRDQPGRFFYDNMLMGLHMVEQSRLQNVEKFVQVGTVCAYPKYCEVPFNEKDLWAGYPEETNAPYGIAKRTIAVMLESYRRQYDMRSAFLLPVNLYGPYDNFDLESSHVIPALIRKVERARRDGLKHITCWGTGNVSREFLFVSDAAEAIVRAVERIDEPLPINLGTGIEIRIRDLAQLIADACEYTGDLRWDSTYPDGQPRRCLDTTRAADLLDWRAKTSFQDGLMKTIRWFRENYDDTEENHPMNQAPSKRLADQRKARVVIGILSANSYDERRSACRETWASSDPAKELEVLFLVGDPDASLPYRVGDILHCPCPDDYDSLPQKTRWFCLWTLANIECEYLFKCDDDTYVAIDRLLAALSDDDYVGFDIGGYASGGAGYILSRRAALAVVANMLNSTGAEDVMVQQALAESAIPFVGDDRFSPSCICTPEPDNDQITAHYCQPNRMRRIHGKMTGKLVEETVRQRLWAQHPHWEDELILFENGIVARSQGDEGEYELESERKLILRWYSWDQEVLFWDAGSREFRSPDTSFTARIIRDETIS